MPPMNDRLRFLINRLGERLWVRPLAMGLLSVGLAFVATLVDNPAWAAHLPDISLETLEVLLKIISASMLVIATFAVGSMVSSYSSASATATPRAFSLVVADDVSQNALSAFIGAFIFSIVSLVVLKQDVYGVAGRFALFCVTMTVFAIVILTFMRWVDCIARLGRVSTILAKVEEATSCAIGQRRGAPTLGGGPTHSDSEQGEPVYATAFGYVQRIELPFLQSVAEQAGVRIAVASLPGAFIGPGRALAYVRGEGAEACAADADRIREAFLIGDERTFEEDPRFGLTVLSEVAGRALSPAVNDPGTAIQVLGCMVRLFAQWTRPVEESDNTALQWDRIEVPSLSVPDLFDDAFTTIARDGAGVVEVATRLQKTLHSLAMLGDPAVRDAAVVHSQRALDRAKQGLTIPADLQVIEDLAGAVASAG